MFRKSLSMVLVMLFTLVQHSLASDDWLDFELAGGVGIEGGDGYGYESFLEYRFSEKTSLYLVGKVIKNMRARTGEAEARETGDIKMAGIQLRFSSIFSIGYYTIINHEITPYVVEKARRGVSIGFVVTESYKDREFGIRWYAFDDTASNEGNSSPFVFFIRKKLSF